MTRFNTHLFTALILLLSVLPSAVKGQRQLPSLQSKKAVRFTSAKKAGANVASKTAYAWVTRDRGNLPLGIVSFDISKPQTLKSLFSLADKAFAGTYGRGKYYFYRFQDDKANQTMKPLALSAVDLKTGTITDVADWSNADFVCNDMAYDYTADCIYAMCRRIYTDEDLNFSIEYSTLLKVDPRTGKYSVAKDFLTDYSGLSNPVYLTLACDMQGNLYSINIAGQLVKFDKQKNFNQTIIGNTGMSPGQYLQCMDFDHGTEKLYWAADYKNKVSNFCLVDTKTGHATEIGTLGTDSRIAGLYIPFDQPADGAPGAPTDLTVKPAANGELASSLSWTNPTQTFGNNALTAITTIEVKRAGKVVQQFTAAKPGETMTFNDTSVPASGLYEYSVVATNAAGTGKSAVQETWVGHDVPSAVTKLGIETLANGAAHLTWTAPTQGAHQGWLDTSTLRYKVTRMPDETVMADNLEALEFTDASLDTLGSYYYVVQAKNADGEGDEARSADIYAGSRASLPYSCNFESKAIFTSWFVIDNNNDGSTWTQSTVTIKGQAQGYAMYRYNNQNAGDDYLISPTFRFKKGHSYTLEFDYRGANNNYLESFDVTMGQGRTVEAQSKKLESFTTHTNELAHASLQIPAPDADGEYNIAFHATSPKAAYNLYVTHVTLRDNGGPAISDLPAPQGLKAEVDATTGAVTLKWNDGVKGTSADINEDFESYDGYQINPSGKYTWNYIDGDGAIPFYTFEDGLTNAALKQPCAAIIMDTTLCQGSLVAKDDPPYAGTKYLMFRSNSATVDGSKPVPAADDWFISPKLSYGQSFVFSFFAKSDPDSYENDPDWKFDKEQIRVGYSPTSKDSTDIIWLTDKNEVVNSTWKQHTYTLPAEAQYVCIHYCTPSKGYLMCLDNVFIGTGSNRAPREAAPAFNHYKVYLDEKQVGTTTANSYKLTQLSKGQHTAKVTAVYDEGESEPAIVNFGVETGISDVQSPKIALYPNPASSTVSFGQKVDKAQLYEAGSGREVKSIKQTDSMDVSSLPAGLYIVRINSNGHIYVSKLVIER